MLRPKWWIRSLLVLGQKRTTLWLTLIRTGNGNALLKRDS
jgi:hypothetical protein